tara:strand:- start:738 stop:1010 length:273 start_codon:yes stop_codon:yes gene_type:complete
MGLTNKRKLSFVFLVLVIGSIVATALSQFISAVLPKGVVQDFFLMSKPIGWDPFTLNLHFIQFTTGLVFEISVLSVIAMAFSWYFLRYFR